MGFVFDWISIFARLAAHAAMTKLSLPHTQSLGCQLNVNIMDLSRAVCACHEGTKLILPSGASGSLKL